MKKVVLLLLSLIMSVSLYSYAEGTDPGVPLKVANHQQQLTIIFPNKQVEKLLGNIVLLPETKDYNKENAQEMIMRISQIHPLILNFFVEQNLKIKLFSGKITDEPSFQSLSGVSPRGWSNGLTWDDVPGGCVSSMAAAKIGSSQTGKGHSSINLELHEIGHLFERNYQELRTNSMYQEIWQEEASSLLPNRQYFKSFPDEYFAEAFAMYYLNESTRELLKEHAEKTYLVFTKLESDGLVI